MKKVTAPEDLDYVRSLAQRLDCMIEEDFRLLAQITPLTANEWRKRRHGPGHVILGTRVLYPNNGVAAFMETLRRDPPAPSGKKLL